MESPYTPAQIIRWLESEDGEEWSRGIHFSYASFHMCYAGIYQIKPLDDPGAASHMDLSRDDNIWWDVFVCNSDVRGERVMTLALIKGSAIPPECV